MRTSLILVPLLLGASPALAQTAAPVAPLEPQLVRVPNELSDPATMDRLAHAVQQVSQALLELPVGEVKAAVEGHPATPAERNMTVGDIIRRHDPDFDRKVARQMAETGPKIRQSMKAIHQALPRVMHGLMEAEQAFDRAAANMPDPTYPNR
jgi:ABC-type transporter Mla subunit MlaD